MQKSRRQNNKKAIFKNCAPFKYCITDCITEINNSKDLHVVMPMYNLIEYSDNYSETFGNLYLFCRDEPNNIITDSK